MDKLLLEYHMQRKGVTIKEMCNHLSMCRSAFYRKCNGQSEFTLSEIQKIVAFLELKSPMHIFFPQKVS